MKTTIMTFAVFLAVAVAAPVHAQISEETLLTADVINEEYDNLVKGAMDLTDAEAAKFWPLYKEYRAERKPLNAERRDLILAFVKESQNLSNYRAEEMLEQFVDIEKREFKLYREYVREFSKVLPAKKVIRFFQIENKLNSAIMSKVAKDVPLAR